jgi:hypothetical protein
MAFICNLGYGLLSRDIEEPLDDVGPHAQNLSDEYDDLDLNLGSPALPRKNFLILNSIF